MALESRECVVGPGILLEQLFGSDAKIVLTLICGDNYAVENQEQMLAAALEKIRAAANKVLNRSVRVCAKIESVAATAAPASRVSDTQELRAKFERDPMVRSMLQRFGGKISEVRRREEGL